MTTDPFPKEAAVKVETAAGTFHVGGMTKGSGMIEPLMATMLGFLTCDAQVEPAMLRKALTAVTRDTFNAITVDGECSTNDTVFAMANGASGVVIDDALYPALEAGLRAVSRELAIAIVRGGEGATKLVAVRVDGRQEWAHAERAARTIANSLLVKTAMHGGDPNWGRLVAAAGRSGVPFELARASVRIGGIVLFDEGQPHDENAEKAAAHLSGQGDRHRGRSRHRRNRAGHDLDVRSQRRVRQNQRRLPDMNDLSQVRTKDFVSMLDFEPAELEACLALAARVKRDRALGKKAPTANALGGAHVALLFEKPSLRTISTFEIAVRELGGDVITPFPVAALSEREPAVDVARNLERWVKCVVMRTYAHSTLLEFAKAAPRLHVVNALSDTEHPCQALADLQTLKEVWGEWAGRTVTFVGDGNNVATSLAQGAVMLGTSFNIASPEGYELPVDGRRTGDAGRAPWRADSVCSAIPTKRSRTPTPSTPTCGRRWARKPKRQSGSVRSTATRSRHR